MAHTACKPSLIPTERFEKTGLQLFGVGACATVVAASPTEFRPASLPDVSRGSGRQMDPHTNDTS
ncbi:hypothetical protein GQ607_011352 [Colletotrichum asianum]|uniref:Uncharacterized protein n=1 Tax=Colletotrichum asianum TaxID=702518 RepID=A0A8H3W6B5_9PEZI|nr:hypothetical protein GQ607_011352 [Colletotrichum asianum]